MSNTLSSAQIIARTNNLYQIFKYTVKLNPARFADMTATTTADLLISMTGTDYTTISRWYLEKRIRSYADYCPETKII